MAKIRTETLIVIIIAWLLIPTGTPDDVITFGIIAKVGIQAYVLLLLIVGGLLYNYHVTPKKAAKTMGSMVRRIFK